MEEAHDGTDCGGSKAGWNTGFLGGTGNDNRSVVIEVRAEVTPSNTDPVVDCCEDVLFDRGGDTAAGTAGGVCGVLPHELVDMSFGADHGNPKSLSPALMGGRRCSERLLECECECCEADALEDGPVPDLTDWSESWR
jgi:hypothetical protein